ncbi:hypothetical protein M440DRAFT_1397690 [Trichoderma longibrachiatum ATCC 18648]|uniref:UBC core domain-containing protein n=1 Tax=Trichoderma longibrachiatum ATCC 18648 TaxID=983965 RepID=A0A2T4CFN5_TRILO|nr:hypothetical protein M440DRAFT_1397690 [Trichoderma longibrachiatum ATCC 18648]
MTSLALGQLPSLWRQHLLSEFAGLKQACPEGVFVSLTPGDPSLWSAVLFVRHGPYAPAVLRFQIFFPDAYPRAPPLVTFSTDIFHPLITPLTTHMYPTSVESDGSTTERPKLPPGGFSLEHGFPEWFGGSRRRAGGSRQGSPGRRGASPSSASTQSAKSASSKSPPVPPKDVPPKDVQPKDVPRYMQTDRKTISTYSLLKYIRSTFDKAEVLDAVPLAAAGNPGAWHAWRTHRRKEGKVFDEKKGHRLSRLSRLSIYDGLPKLASSEQGDAAASDAKSIGSQSTTREPGDWNWDGVWEDRVKKGVASTLTESVLYGASGISDDMIHFLALEEGTIEAVKGNLRRTLDASA